LSPTRGAWSADNPGNRAAREELFGAIRRAAAAQLAGDGDLLDCGCGTGWLLEALAADGIAPRRLYGVDADSGRVAATQRRVPGAAVDVAAAQALPFDDGAFGAVFMVVSLSSMGSKEAVLAALAESRRVLTPDGALFVYEPRFPNPLNRRTRLLRRADLAAAGLTPSESRSLTLLPPLGRRLGRFTPDLHPRLSALPPLRSHRLLVHRSSAPARGGAPAPAARTRAPSPPR
jgi:SAM-dependent methyltransferase